MEHHLRGGGNIRASTKMGRCLADDDVRDRCPPLDVDVFHVPHNLEDYHRLTRAARFAGSPSRGHREVESGGAGLSEFLVGTQGQEFTYYLEGNTKTFRSTVCDFSDPYWRIEHQDGDWKELTTSRNTTRSTERPTIHVKFGPSSEDCRKLIACLARCRQ